MLHIVFVGNPGVGKTTIINTLIGKKVFRSGVSLGQGLTDILQSHTEVEHGVTYSDTPGLDDEQKRLKAAEEISLALSRATSLCLIFVASLEAGRVRPSDVATVEVVLQAIEKVGINVDNRFSLIVNKCSEEEISLLEKEENDRLIREKFGRGRQLSHVCFLPDHPELRGKNDRLFTERGPVEDFMGKALVLVMPRQDISVDAELYTNVEKELRRQKEIILRRIRELQEKKTPFWVTAASFALGIILLPVGLAAGAAMSAASDESED